MANDPGTAREGVPGPKSISGDVTCLLLILEAVEKSGGNQFGRIASFVITLEGNFERQNRKSDEIA